MRRGGGNLTGKEVKLPGKKGFPYKWKGGKDFFLSPSLDYLYCPSPWSKNLDPSPSKFDLAHVCWRGRFSIHIKRGRGRKPYWLGCLNSLAREFKLPGEGGFPYIKRGGGNLSGEGVKSPWRARKIFHLYEEGGEPFRRGGLNSLAYSHTKKEGGRKPFWWASLNSLAREICIWLYLHIWLYLAFPYTLGSSKSKKFCSRHSRDALAAVAATAAVCRHAHGRVYLICAGLSYPKLFLSSLAVCFIFSSNLNFVLCTNISQRSQSFFL